jgi:uncharacterized membrane protein (DUF4010 family)
MYGVGAALALGEMVPAVMVGGGVAVLLHWKKPLHALVERFGKKDLRAIIQLTLIALVILPILPNKTYGPYDVLNPFALGLMVVLIVGISVGSYIAYKFLGPRAGTLLGGVLGGLISSTATTVSYARRSRRAPDSAPAAALVILIASAIVFLRVGGEVAIVAPNVLWRILPPLAVMAALMIALSAALYLPARRQPPRLSLAEDPSQLRAAVVFGLLYAGILFAVAAVKVHFGSGGLYVVAGLSGLTDVDAITLSTAQLIRAQRLPADTGWRMILLAGMSNIVFKGAAVAVLGGRALRRRVAILFGISLAGGALILLLWPTVT